MALRDDLDYDVTAILSKEWNVRKGLVVPFTNDIALGGGAVRLRATMLYADLADSTELAMQYDWRVAAKVFKCFLTCCSRLIRARGGEIRSFDGDRVMGIFIGQFKDTLAAQCALQINYAFTEVIKPKLEAKYTRIRSGPYQLAHGVGVDTGEVIAVRGGVVNHNDLVWVGRAPNVAAKLSALRESPFHSFITPAVYRAMDDNVRYDPGGELMWSKMTWGEVEGMKEIYGSTWWMLP
jgi:adenylate cyclase